LDSSNQSPAFKSLSLETSRSPILSVSTTGEGQDPFPELSFPETELLFPKIAFSFPENSGPTPVFDNPVYSRDQTPTRNYTQPFLPLVTPPILATPQSTRVPVVLSTPVPSVGIMARTTLRYDTFDGSSSRDPEMFMCEFEGKAKSNDQGIDDLKASIFGGLMIKLA
jgi:hypothetical protein